MLSEKALNSARVGNPARAPKTLQPSAATAHPIFMLISVSSPALDIWCPRRDSNPEPTDYETV
jgi:hypothetical protein